MHALCKHWQFGIYDENKGTGRKAADNVTE